MILLKWCAFGLLGFVILAVLVLTIGSLMSLDWKKQHTAASDNLRFLNDVRTTPGGLALIPVGNMRFRARVANLSSQGEGIIMLHGFPQTSASWKPLIDAAAARDYRAIAFDQRGYSPGARPGGIDAYTINQLVSDVIGVADAAGFDRFHLVGHDWGSAVGWSVVMAHPERILTWSSLSIAHPFAFVQAVQSDPDQKKRSSYFLLFRTPWLPELLLSFNNLQRLRSIAYQSAPPDHLDEYLSVFAEPGALTGALNWYRAMGRGSSPPANPNIETPVLFIWGNRDPAAGRKAVELQEQYIRGVYRKIELDAGHWLLETRTDDVVNAVLEHIATVSDPAEGSFLSNQN